MITIKLKQDVWIGGVKQLAESNVLVDDSFAATLISEYKAYPPDGWNEFPAPNGATSATDLDVTTGTSTEYMIYTPAQVKLAAETFGRGAISSVATSRSALLSDANAVLECNSTSAVNITIEPDSTTNHPANTIITIYQVGTGASLFVAGSGVTIQGTAPTATQYTHIAVRKRSVNVWAWV